MDILENPGLRGRAFVDTLASLGDTLEDGPSWGQLGANMGQHGPAWGHLGANLGPTWANLDQLGPTWANLGPTWDQLGAHLGPTWGNLGQLGATWGQLKPAWANRSHCGLTWGQLEANMNPKIIGKPLFFLGFSNILKKSLEAFWNALADHLGTPWGRLGRLWGRLGRLWGRLGKPWERLGRSFWEDLPWKTLGKPGKTLPESTFARKTCESP